MSPRPSRQFLVGVVQYEIELAYAASSAWNCSQKPLVATSPALVCAGASPNHSATWSLTLGEMIQSIHLYTQFGWAALLEIIQVSDQPVAPSVGTSESTLTLPSPL